MAAEDINIMLEMAAENISREINDITIEINDATESCYAPCIPNLLKNIEIFNNEYKKSADRMEVIFQSQSRVLNEVEKLEADSTFEI